MIGKEKSSVSEYKYRKEIIKHIMPLEKKHQGES